MEILVTGASGFIGGPLCRALVEQGHQVRAMTRHPDTYEGAGTPVFGDTSDRSSLTGPLEGVQVAYYLVHSLDSPDFEQRDAEAGKAFSHAAKQAGVEQIVYMGGLGADGDGLSAHLRSRRQVETLLGADGVPVTVLRAAIVVGAGGISWEITRQLVKHLPAMVAPRWVRTKTQPIALDDVVRYLVGVAGNEQAVGRVFEIGGPDQIDYAQMLQVAGRLTNGRTVPILTVPVLTPGLSSRWLALVTDVDATTGRHLIDSMDVEVLVEDHAIREVVPFEPMGYEEAVRRALQTGPGDDTA